MGTKHENAILELLEKSAEPLSTGEIQAKLRSKPSRATVKRAVAELRARGVVEKTGTGSQTRYLRARTNESFPAVSKSATAAETSDPAHRLQEFFRRPMIKRKPVSYDKTRWLNYVPGRSQLVDESTLSQLEAVGKDPREGASLPPGTFVRKVIKTFLADLAFNSSRLEGNTISLAETRELFENPPEDLSDPEKVMLINHRSAITWLVDNVHTIDLSLGGHDVKEVHFHLMSDLLAPGRAGVVREEPVAISGSTYKPAMSRQTLTDSLHMICQKAHKIPNPFEQSFFLLLHITYLQAFVDGNKRTARMMCNYPLIRDNLIPQSFHSVETERYRDAVVYYYETGDHRPFLALFAEGYIAGSDRYLVIREETAAPDMNRVRLRAVRNPLVARVVRNHIPRGELRALIAEEAPKVAAEINLELVSGDDEFLLAQILADLDWLKESKTGLSSFDLTEDEREAWLNGEGGAL